MNKHIFHRPVPFVFSRAALLRSSLVLGALVVLAGCAGNVPYVYRSGEFNRRSQSYGQEITDRTQVTVCYSTLQSTPQQVAAVAADECRKFSKAIRYIKHDYSICPLSTPAAAVFACVKKR